MEILFFFVRKSWNFSVRSWSMVLVVRPASYPVCYCVITSLIFICKQVMKWDDPPKINWLLMQIDAISTGRYYRIPRLYWWMAMVEATVNNQLVLSPRQSAWDVLQVKWNFGAPYSYNLACNPQTFTSCAAPAAPGCLRTESHLPKDVEGWLPLGRVFTWPWWHVGRARVHTTGGIQGRFHS